MKTAYPRFTNAVSIRLYSNIPFDNTYKHHSLISSKFTYNNSAIYTGGNIDNSCVERFINRKDYNSPLMPYYYPRYNLTGEFNFDFSNGLIGSVVLELTPEQTNANYMRVKVGDSVNGYDYYYYFVTGISQINSDTYKLSLELDVLMTYQDEFLDGMKDVPVFTNRKHCHRYTNDGLMPHCADLKTGDDAFMGVKPSIIEKVQTLAPTNANMNSIKNVVWLYLLADNSFNGDTSYLASFSCNGVQYPFIELCLPLNVSSFTINKADGTEFHTFTSADIKKCISQYLINNGSLKGAKISNYPPFYTGNITYNSLTGNLTLKASSQTITTTGNITLMTFKVGYTQTELWCVTSSSPMPVGGFLSAMSNGCLLIANSDMKEINTTPTSVSFDMTTYFKNSSAPIVTKNRYVDPKLLFAPFKKYLIMAQFNSQGCEFYPELLFSEYTTDGASDPVKQYFTFSIITTPYIADNNVFIYLEPYTMDNETNEQVFFGYRRNKIGLASNMNYTMPVGENALEVFNATQQNSFYQSKVASGITGGLSIAGGALSIGLGVAGAVGSLGLSTPASVGLIAGGVTAIGSGIAGVTNTIKSASAKIEDLKNTPDSVNISGSNFLTDDVTQGSYSKYGFITIYKVSSVIEENANDYFYNYGYQVARECYFNTEMMFDNDVHHKIDNNLFGRTIFNYIQTNDDITNKIDANIPLIIKQKINAIFNSGITLWSWFGFNELWGEGSGVPLPAFRLDKWFMKCLLDNTEYYVATNDVGDDNGDDNGGEVINPVTPVEIDDPLQPINEP